MLLTTAREILNESVLHIGNTTFSLAKQDRAIKAACHEFIRATNCTYTTTEIDIASGAEALDITATLPQFHQRHFKSARIVYSPVQMTTTQSLERKFDGQTETGKPQLIAFYAPGDAILWPQPDDDYTLKLTHRATLTDWTDGYEDSAGSSDDVNLNIPDEWVYDVLWWGARGRLLRGAPGHPDAEAATVEFQKILERAALAFAVPAPGVTDRNTA